MSEAIALSVAGLGLYWAGIWFIAAVRMNRLERRQYYNPPTGGPWVHPAGRYSNLAQ